MATTIITKNGSGAPADGDLSVGELAIDLTNKQLYTKNSGGVIKLGGSGNSGEWEVNGNDIYYDTGNVGIGTNSPDSALDVRGTILGGDNAPSIGQIAFGVQYSGSTNIPNTFGTMKSSASTCIGWGVYGSPTTNNGFVSSVDNTLNFSRGALLIDQDELKFLNAGQQSVDRDSAVAMTERFRLESSGNLRLGYYTTSGSASSLLDLSFVSTNNTEHEAINFKTDNTAGRCYINFERGSSSVRGDLIFGTSNSESARITWDGKFGIGNTSPSRTLNLGNGTATANARIDSSTSPNFLFSRAGTEIGYIGTTLWNTGSGSDTEFSIRGASAVGFAIGSSERMRLDSSGNLLVGATSNNPADTCRVYIKSSGTTSLGVYHDTTNTAYGVAGFFSNVGGTNTLVCKIAANGNITNVNNSYGAISDERLKSNIVDASSQLDDIMAVQVRNYTLNSTGDTHMGVVAQELEAAGMSGLVDEDEEGMKSVKYSILYLKAIKALQEAVTRIETLEAEVAALKGA